MSLIPLVLPLQLPVRQLVDDAKHEARLQDKELAADGDYTPADWAKAKAGVRSLDLHRIAKMPEAFQLALVRRWEAALTAQQPTGGPDRDLVADLIGRVDRLLAAMGPWRPVKADLKDDASEQKTA
jgi:hypothetical protein